MYTIERKEPEYGKTVEQNGKITTATVIACACACVSVRNGNNRRITAGFGKGGSCRRTWKYTVSSQIKCHFTLTSSNILVGTCQFDGLSALVFKFQAYAFPVGKEFRRMQTCLK